MSALPPKADVTESRHQGQAKTPEANLLPASLKNIRRKLITKTGRVFRTTNKAL
jgi:hypothetical protein